MRIIRLLTGCLANLFAHQHVIAKQNCFWEIVVRRLQERVRPQRLPLDCFWEIVVRRLQDAHSMASTYPYAGGKGILCFAYGVSMAFQIQSWLTITG